MHTPTIAIVGAGFSGTLLALQAVRHCPAPTRVVLIERHPRFGHGQAYATTNPSHLLNVPAGRMSAFPDRPLDFLHWLQERTAPGCTPPTPACFAPRRAYGAYIRHLLQAELRRPDSRLELLRGDVLGLELAPGPVLRLDRGRTLAAELAVLAVGNFPPEPPRLADPAFYDGPLYQGDPWAPDALAGLDPEAPVLLIGTSLTMVDAVISLLDQGHRGPVHAVSRHGLLPRRHLAGTPAAAPPGQPVLSTALPVLLRSVRRAAARAAAEDGNWQAVIDGLRPFTLDLWQGLSVQDRQRFLRHLRRWWEVHRHRMAGAVADRIEAAQASGQLAIHAGRLRSLTAHDGGAQATIQPRGGAPLRTLPAARVVNCAGPCADYERIGHPLIRALLQDGAVRPDPLRLGLDVTGSCAVLDREGAISRHLFAVGPVTRGAFWEMTAVPDIRRQCESLALHLATLIPMPPPRPAAGATGAARTAGRGQPAEGGQLGVGIGPVVTLNGPGSSQW